MTRVFTILTATVLILLSTPAFAQSVGANDIVRYSREFKRVGGGVEVFMHRAPSANGWSIRIVNKRSKTLAVTTLPEWAGASYYEIAAVADKIGSAWVLTLEARPSLKMDAPPAAETYQAAFVYGKSPRTGRTIWKVLATANYSALDGGERLVFRQNQRTGQPELLRVTTAASTFCGGEAGYQQFVPSKLAFRSELNQELLKEGASKVDINLPDQKFQQPLIRGYYLWYSATSDRRNPDDSLTVIRPLALGDGELSTAWTEGDAGLGEGQYVTARVNPGLKLRGLRIFPGHGATEEFTRYRRPKSLLVSFQDGTRYAFDLPDLPLRTLQDRGGIIVKFPASIRTNCVSVVIMDTRAGSNTNLGEDAWKAQTTAIAEVTPLSELYGLSRGDAAIVVVEMLLKQDKPADARRLATLASPLGEDLVNVLSQVVASGSAEDRARIAPLLRYLPAEQSVPVLTKLFESVDSKDKSYLAVKRSLVTHRRHASRYLIDMLNENPPEDERKHIDLIRMVGRLGKPDDIRPMIAKLGEGNSRMRDERIRAIARGGEPLLPDLFAVVDKDPNSPAGMDALKTIASLGRKLYFRDQGTAAGSQALLRAARDAEFKRTRLLSTRALGYFKTEGAAQLLSNYATSQRDPLLRKVATESVGRYPGDDVRLVLEKQLKDPSPDVRIKAAEAIGTREDKVKSVPALVAYLKKERWSVGLDAGYQVLAKTGDEEALRSLEADVRENLTQKRAELAAAAVQRAEKSFTVPTIKEIVDSDKTAFLLKRHAVDMLGVEQTEDGEVLLLDIIGTPNRFPSLDANRNETLRGRAILSLGRRRGNEARDALLYILRDEKESHTQKIVLRALSFFADEVVIAELEIIKETAPEDLVGAYDDAISMIERRVQIRGVGETIEEVDERLQNRQPPPK